MSNINYKIDGWKFVEIMCNYFKLTYSYNFKLMHFFAEFIEAYA